MGSFATELKRLMAKQKVSVAEMESRTKGAIRISTLRTLLRNTIPLKLSLIDTLAKQLGESPVRLRAFAFRDHAERLLRHFSLKWSDVMPKLHEQQRNQWKVPVFRLSEISDRLTTTGFFKKESAHFLSVGFDYGPSALAVYDDVGAFFHRVRIGEIAILTAESPMRFDEDFGILCAFDKFYAGKITTPIGGISVNTLNPYGVHHFHKKDVSFIFWVVGILRLSPAKLASIVGSVNPD